MRLILLIAAFFVFQFGFGQNQANWWFFGSNAGLDFNSGAPVATAVGQLNTIEGCAAISDACGNLLFYTDGISIWNSNHTIMPNGFGLLGNPSSTQSGIILPLPESNNFYYVFTVDLRGSSGLNYTIVDMNLDNGNGDVVPGSKNINLLPNSTEKIFAGQASDGRDAWIVTFAEENIGSLSFNQFYAFRLTPNGIDLSATATSRSNNTRTTDARGYLRVSPDGSHVAMMTQNEVQLNNPDQAGYGAWLFDFDSQTGIVDNPVRLEFPSGYQAYGTEFSPNSQLVYVDLNRRGSGLVPDDRLLLQYELTAANFQTNPITIYASDPSDSSDDTNRGALQIGPDKKIYYARDQEPWLAVINNPDEVGALANFQYDGLALAPNTNCNEGLPPFYNAFFNPSFAVEEGCAMSPSSFRADELATCANTSVVWDFGDPTSGTLNSSQNISPTHIYQNPGIYTVQLTITTPMETFTASRDIQIVNTPQLNPVVDQQICDDSMNDGLIPIDLNMIRSQALGNQNPTEFEVSLHFNQQDADADFNALSDGNSVPTGTYVYRIDSRTSNGCYVTSSFDLVVLPSPSPTVINDLVLCDDYSNDGTEEFDLSMAGDQGLGTMDPAIFEYDFFPSRQEALMDQNQLPVLFENTANPQEIFVRYRNRQFPQCELIQSFFLRVSRQPEIPLLDRFTICDDDQRDGVENFDLGVLETQLINNPASQNLSFHPSRIDAENNQNPLPSIYNTSSTEIWIRLEEQDITNCLDIAPLELVVFEKPTVDLGPDLIKCAREEIILSATPGFINYRWSTGENTADISAIAAGTYTVEVTDANGCTATDSIEIEHYAPTQINDVEVRQFTLRDNRIEVFASGEPGLEYSLDNFIYQSSPVFTDLLPGYYTIYVRDTNGCDVVEAPATIIAAPAYFTPNQDGFHDTWQVTAIETEPDAEIFIFDRFGKLLKQLSPLGPGWDGTYNNNPMPSTDYWFSVRLNDGRSFKGHFSLKR
ncbi:T9SS type B sorting domain-containing protein [Nonlabens xiamenensis]|uniref:T9SS type B sorting domain-containing protein n=1 Tax=Nonlabens xiamenensis TaxID=2341043 RepID=UPI000F607943|nr:T9SS type B sorting domain-containing protein [Nonlabens xiamenensis]